MANDLNVVYRISADIAGLKDAVPKATQVTSALAKSATDLGTAFDSGFNKLTNSVQRGVGTVTAELLLAQKEVKALQTLVLKNADKPGFVAALGYELDAAIPKVAGLEKELSGLQTTFVSSSGPTHVLGGFFGDLSKSIVSTAAGFVSAQAIIGGVSRAFSAMTGFVEDSVTAYGEAEAAQKRLTTALQTQGTATPAIIAQYNDLATQFQNTTVFSDDLITSMEALLVQVGNVMPSAMQSALKASTDLAAGLGIDLETATTLVAKAAAGHTETLGRYGIKVDQAKLQTEGFSAVLDAINHQFGGQAAAQLDTYAGRIEHIKNEWNNLQEAIGGAIVTDPLVAAGLRTISTSLGDLETSSGRTKVSLAQLNDLIGAFPGSSVIIAALEGWASAANDAASAMERLKAAQISPEPSHLQPFAPVASHGPDTGFVEGLRQGADALDEIHDAFKKFKQEQVDAELKRQREEWNRWIKSIDDATVHLNLSTFTLNRYGAVTLPSVTSALQDTRTQWEGWIEPLDGVAVGVKLTADDIERLQRSGQFATVAMDGLNQQLLKLPNVHSSLEGVDTEIHQTGDALGELSKAFSELAQISDGALGTMVRGFGTVISSINLATKSMGQLDDNTKLLGNLTGIAGYLGVWSEIAHVVNQLTGPFDNAVTHLRDLVLELQKSGQSLADFVTQAHNAGISLDALFHAKDAATFQTELQKVKDQLAGISQAASDASKEIADAMHAGGAKTNEELQHAADVAHKAFDDALASGKYNQENLDKLYLAFQQALADTGDAVARAWLKAHQEAAGAVAASSDAMKSAENDLKALLSKRDSLAAGIAAEAPEAVMGVIETQQRGELKALDGEIQRKADDYAKLAKETGQEMAQAIIDALSKIHIDPLHIGVILDGPTGSGGIVAGGPDPGSFTPGGRPETSRFAGLDYNAYLRDYWAPDRNYVLSQIPHAARGGMVRDWGIEHFATGGIAGWRRGVDTVPAMLTPGEMVLTKDQQRSMGGIRVGSIAVQMSVEPGTDQRQLAEQFKEILRTDATVYEAVGIVAERKIVR